MKIYFAAAVTHSREHLPQYKQIVDIVEQMGHSVLSKHILDPHLKKGDWQKRWDAERLYKREIDRVKEAECMIAEVSTPSWGTPFMIAKALELNKPVLALFYGNNPQDIPLMIKGHPELYVENYDEDNIKIILNKYLVHFLNHSIRKGKLIVIDGGDGSGKGTQTELLANFLKSKNIPVKVFDFPRYYTSFHGKMVGRFLAGDFGKLDDVSPYLASLAYALDRASAKEEMDDWLAKGGMIICNRYATSSMAHQGARLPKGQQNEFIEWIDELEYKVHKIPREDLVIYLYVPWKIGFELTKKKNERGYVKGMDIAEKDLKHRQEAEQSYLSLAKKRKNWIKINCMDKTDLRTIDDIHKEIVEVLTSHTIIPS